MPQGYTKPLYILAFDHRSSFTRGLMGVTGELSLNEARQVSELKTVVWRGAERAVAAGVPRESAAVLVDEQFGSLVLKEAAAAGVVVCLPVEQSGQAEFAFEYGGDYASHIEQYHPTFVKALIRYNPEGETAFNQRQLERLAELSGFCAQHGYLFLAEVLVPPTAAQLAAVSGNPLRYEIEVRPQLTRRLVREFHTAGVEPDVWKVEGFTAPEAYVAAVKAMREAGRDSVSMVVLGRGQDAAAVESWLRAARGVPGVIGFAIGRTIFWEPLGALLRGQMSADQAAEVIARGYTSFWRVFTG